MIREAPLLCAAAAVLVLLHPAVRSAAQAAARPPTRFLLLDERVVDKRRTRGVRLAVGKVAKHAGNPLFAEEHPWEPRFDNLYANVFYDADDELYKCWYSPFIIDRPTSETPRARRKEISYRQVARKVRAGGKGKWREMGVCYAVSKDGLRWTKPLMDIHEFNGRKSNILVAGPHGAGIFKDPPRREKNPRRRYKMIFKGAGAMAVAFSADGLHWSKPTACPAMRARGDTHNNAFWAPELKKYVAITRLWDGQRIVGRSESDDFVHWTPAKEVLRGTKANQTYAMPVFRYADVYLGLVMILRTKEDRVHCELTWSADTVTWRRIDAGTPLIANAAKKGAYDWGCVYAAAYPVVRENEIRLYYGACNNVHGNWRDGFFALATLRPDGFAGYSPTDPAAEGTVVTQPLKCAGKTLRITADAKGGRVRVRVDGADGEAVAESKPVSGNVTDAPLAWQSGDLSSAAGKQVRLRFTLRRAMLYSFRFAD